MFLNVAGDKQLETVEDFKWHLKKAKSEKTLEIVVERIFERNGGGALLNYSHANIDSLMRNRYLYPYGNLLKAAQERRKEIQFANLPQQLATFL